jgi:hypothetical protein
MLSKTTKMRLVLTVSVLIFSAFGLDGILQISGAQSIRLWFPLGGLTAYNALISSVLDHSTQKGFYCNDTYTPAGSNTPRCGDGVVLAYTGERGEYQYGASQVTGSRYWGYKKEDKTAFQVNGNYNGGGNKFYLYYDGHPGYDYPYAVDTLIFAPAEGTARIPSSDPINTQPSKFNTFKIEHGNGYETWYLHAKTVRVRDGQYVQRGDPIATVGNTGTGGYHLHFEVRQNGIIVDPYGWQGSPALWQNITPVRINSINCVQQSKTVSCQSVSSKSAFTLTVNGSNFDTGAIVEIYYKPEGRFVGAGAVESRSASRLVTAQQIGGAGTYWVVVRNSTGLRSNGVLLRVN